MAARTRHLGGYRRDRPRRRAAASASALFGDWRATGPVPTLPTARAGTAGQAAAGRDRHARAQGRRWSPPRCARCRPRRSALVRSAGRQRGARRGLERPPVPGGTRQARAVLRRVQQRRGARRCRAAHRDDADQERERGRGGAAILLAEFDRLGTRAVRRGGDRAAQDVPDRRAHPPGGDEPRVRADRRRA